MKALSCRLIQFRNVEDRTFVPGEGLTVFTGPNGSGKTNVLEAFFLASIGRSLRTHQDQEMIGLSHEEGTVILSYVSGGVENTIKVRLFRKGCSSMTTRCGEKTCWGCSVRCCSLPMK